MKLIPDDIVERHTRQSLDSITVADYHQAHADRGKLLEVVIAQQAVIDGQYLVLDDDRKLIKGYRETLEKLMGLKNA